MSLRPGLARKLALLALMAIAGAPLRSHAESTFQSQTATVPSGQTKSALPEGNTADDTPSVTSSPLGLIFDYQGLRVRDIQFRGVEGGEISQLRQVITQLPNQPLDRLKIAESVRALYDTGRFADIQVEAERRPQNEVSLVFVATENYFVGMITVNGVPKDMTSNQLVNATKLQLGELYTPEKLRLGIDRMQLLLQENGYYQNAIHETEVTDPKTQQLNLTFDINPGEPAHVGKVTVEGKPGYNTYEILEIAHLHPGDRAASQRITQALQRLKKKYTKKDYLEAQVSVTKSPYQPQKNAVDYTFEIQTGPTVEILVQGVKVRKGVLKKYIPVYEENAVDEDLLNEGRRNLRDYLQTKGYFDAQVDMRKETDAANNHLRIVYDVKRGIRHELSEVQISGNKYFDGAAIRQRMRIQPAGRLFSNGLYSQEMLTNDISNIEDLYHGNGFQQVKVTPTVLDDYKGQEGHMAVAIQIEEGAQTTVASLQILGNRTIPDEQLRGKLYNVNGEPFSESNIASDRDAILTEYFNSGFPKATFEYSTTPSQSGPNQIDVTYTIVEGERFYVDQVVVDGLHFTRPYVARRELQISPRTPISQEEMYKSQQNLYDLGIFNEVDTAVQNPDGDTPSKNVLFRVQEAKRYTFNYGFGFEAQTGQPAGPTQPQGETGVSPRVSFDMTRLNFRGRDHTISFKSHLGRLQQRALLSYDAPRWFNNPNLRLTLTTFYDNTLDVLTFTSKRLEGSAQIEQTWSKVTTTLYRFTYRRVQATNLVISPDLIPVFSQPVRVGMPTFTYIRDKRDNPIETHKGNYTTFDTGVAAGFFGSQASFSRLLLQNSTYMPIAKKWVFARSTRLGIENLFGKNQVIPLPERFLAGGGNSHRGFAINQAGPRDPQSGAPLGGDAVFINNLELRTPPVVLPFVEDNLSFAFFHDAGNVFTAPNDMLKGLTRMNQDTSGCTLSKTSTCNFNYISQALGAGVRYKTPIGPVRVDFGYNLNPPLFPVLSGDQSNPQPHIETGRHFNFFFSIGQTF